MKYFGISAVCGRLCQPISDAGVFTEVQQFDKVKLHGRVNEWLKKKGFAIHENPCRKEFVRRGRRICRIIWSLMGPQTGKVWRFGQTRPLIPYFPFGNTGVDGSDSITARPGCACTVKCAAGGGEGCDVEFELETCGGVTIRVEGGVCHGLPTPFYKEHGEEDDGRFARLRREKPASGLPDDLVERDTDYYFA